jgi:hypothetical protein
MRVQMSSEQRGIWADFLALAGESRTPGVISLGETKGKLEAYPLDYLAGLLRVKEEVLREAIQLFKDQGRITVSDIGVIYITSWAKYQSEYQRQQKYRTNVAPGKSVDGIGPAIILSRDGDGSAIILSDPGKEKVSIPPKEAHEDKPISDID